VYPFPDDRSLLVVEKASQTAPIYHGYRFDIATKFMTDLGVVDGAASVSPQGDMVAWYGAHIGGLWISTVDGTQTSELGTAFAGYRADAWTGDGKYVVSGGLLVDVTTGATILLPWMSNAALRWTFTEAGARP